MVLDWFFMLSIVDKETTEGNMLYFTLSPTFLMAAGWKPQPSALYWLPIKEGL